jgi:regulatory protein
VWAGKFDAPPKDFKERAKQMRFLLGRGFGAEVVRQVLKKQQPLLGGAVE